MLSIGVSEIVRDLETVFLEEYEPEVQVLEIRGLYVRRFKHDVEGQLGNRVKKPAVMEAHTTASAEEERAFDLLTGLELPALDAAAGGGILFRTGLLGLPLLASGTSIARFLGF